MTSPVEPNLRKALQGLAETPGPGDLADRALNRAKGLRRGRNILLGTAALVGVLMVPLLAYAGAGPGPLKQTATGPIATAPRSSAATASPTVPAECGPVENDSAETNGIARSRWPQFIQIVMGQLPARGDYLLRYAYGVCDPGYSRSDRSESNAYAVIDLGPLREHGHLTVNLDTHANSKNTPATCIEVLGHATQVQDPSPPPIKVLFCKERTATTPMVFGTELYSQVTVGAVYADERMVWIESFANKGAQAISANALRSVVGDPALAGLLPTD